MSRRLLAACLLSLAAAAPVAAGEERFGFSDPALADRFSAELNAILLAPPAPQGRSADAPTDDEKSAIQSDRGLKAAWRSDPDATLDLIRRIREAGGLQ